MGTIDDEEAPLPDHVLVAALTEGDEATFVRLVDSWSPGMLRTARGYVVNQESAEDVVQDTWLAVLRGVRRFEGRSSLRTWVYRILINTAKTHGVRESRTVPVADLADAGAAAGAGAGPAAGAGDSGPTVDPARFRGPDDASPGGWKQLPPAWPTPESELMSKEVRGEVEAALAGLPARQRIVITLRDVEGYSSEEVCAILEISPANQRVLLHRARAVVRGRLAAYFAGSAVAEGAPR